MENCSRDPGCSCPHRHRSHLPQRWGELKEPNGRNRRAVCEGVNKLAVSTMSAVRWLLSAVYCTCFADQTTKSGQWVISSSKQVHYTSDNSQLTADKFRRLPDFFHSSYRPRPQSTAPTVERSRCRFICYGPLA